MGFVTWVMLANFEPFPETYGRNRQTIYFIVPLIVGCVFMFCMTVTIQLYLMLLGGLGGLAAGLWVLGWKESLSIQSEHGRAIFLTVLIVLMMVMSLYRCFWHRLGTSLAGSYIFFMGLDIYFHTGFLYCFTSTLDGRHEHHYVVYRSTYIMQACLIVAFIITYLFQSSGRFNDHLLFQHSVVMKTMLDPAYNKAPIMNNNNNSWWMPTRYIPSTWYSWRPPMWPAFVSNNRTTVPPLAAVAPAAPVVPIQ
ncbi:uncharacterized protein BX663DRAFT_524609 [Cokeromyces recurvatus]|uniref:uncharacterized protein n=1 Tax=Cokeromyces recurvatus TaxID=90255 RepID=UPI002220A0B7|nr:uncharacterized protein BX663DRAFT_524609 [Cokeromyces recurvatus]KAI7898564.1 hypothetical protein BX663DRAFT_524609 [Cokeromyces recurvatus]